MINYKRRHDNITIRVDTETCKNGLSTVYFPVQRRQVRRDARTHESQTKSLNSYYTRARSGRLRSIKYASPISKVCFEIKIKINQHYVLEICFYFQLNLGGLKAYLEFRCPCAIKSFVQI